MRLVWYNAFLYNKPETRVHQNAKILETEFEQKLASSMGSTANSAPTASSHVPLSTVPVSSVRQIIKSLTTHVHSTPFRQPVDWEKLNLPSYPQIITRPMDLSRVTKRLEEGTYATIKQAPCPQKHISQPS